MSTDSLRRRYFAKLLANMVSMASQVVMHSIIPRSLGPVAYGNFSFLTNFYSQLVSVFDSGSSSGFYAKLSQRPKDLGLIGFYFYFVIGVFIFIVAINALLIGTGWNKVLLPGQEAVLMFAAAMWGVLIWGTDIISKINDAMGFTVEAEKLRSFQVIFAVALILVLYVSHSLGIYGVFLYYYLTQLFLGLTWLVMQTRRGVDISRYVRLRWDEAKSYLREFYLFCRPLFVFAIIGTLPGIVDRWILQNFGGAAEQGFFGLSYRIGAMAFFFSSTMSPLFAREFSRSFGDNDLVKMRHMVNRYVPFFYMVSAYFSVFLAINATVVLGVIGGSAFGDALVPVMIMSLMPMHQTYGQMNASVFYSTGQTRLYSNVGIAGMIVGLPATYFLIAPHNQYGLNLGATGLALKVVLMQVVVVNFQLLYVTRIVGASFSRILTHQALVAALFAFCAFVSSFAVSGFGVPIAVHFVLSGLLYTACVAGCLYTFPLLSGFSRDEMRTQVGAIKDKIFCRP